LCPGCFVEEKLRHRDHLTMVWIKKDFPYFFANRTPSWFPGHFTTNALMGEIFFQALNLRGLATSLDPFESNKEKQSRDPPSESNRYKESILKSNLGPQNPEIFFFNIRTHFFLFSRVLHRQKGIFRFWRIAPSKLFRSNSSTRMDRLSLRTGSR
jgi:hypothetical protein